MTIQISHFHRAASSHREAHIFVTSSLLSALPHHLLLFVLLPESGIYNARDGYSLLWEGESNSMSGRSSGWGEGGEEGEVGRLPRPNSTDVRLWTFGFQLQWGVKQQDPNVIYTKLLSSPLLSSPYLSSDVSVMAIMIIVFNVWLQNSGGRFCLLHVIPTLVRCLKWHISTCLRCY